MDTNKKNIDRLRKFFQVIEKIQGENCKEGTEGNHNLQILFFSLMRSLNPDMFLEVGANDGSTSIVVRSVLPDCLIHSFEANRKIFNLNRDRLSRSHVHSWNLAVSSRDEMTKIYIPLTISQVYVNGEVVPRTVAEPENTGKSSILQRDHEATYEEQDVQAIKLDSFIEKNVPDWQSKDCFLWIDVEGATNRVLEGAPGLLKKTLCIFMEIEGLSFWRDQSDPESVLSGLNEQGFIPVARDREYGDSQFNIILCHKSIIEKVVPVLVSWSSSIEKKYLVEYRPGSRLSEKLLENIPIVIPCFESVTYVRNMVFQLLQKGLENIILVDNASTYEPMRSFLNEVKKDVTVIFENENRGPRDIFLNKINYDALPDIFCVTDPDLLFNPDLPFDFMAQLLTITNQLQVGKAGFALDISAPQDMKEELFAISGGHYKICDWEAQFWEHMIGYTSSRCPIYKAYIDTTFSLYNKKFFNPQKYLDAVRVGGVFTCKHLPWYKKSILPHEEEVYYKSRAKDSFYLRDETSPPLRT